MNPIWEKVEFKNASAECVAHRKRVQEEIMNFMKQSLYLNGLPEDFVEHITTSKAETMKEMSTAAKNHESGKRAAASVRSHRAAAIAALTPPREERRETPKEDESEISEETVKKVRCWHTWTRRTRARRRRRERRRRIPQISHASIASRRRITSPMNAKEERRTEQRGYGDQQ